MKKCLMIHAIVLLGTNLQAQQKEAAEKLVSEGVKLHDKQDYNGALAKYEEALKLDKDNAAALAEKGYTYLSMHKYEEAIKACQEVFKKHPENEDLESVYVTYGNTYDEMKMPQKSLEVYKEGIARYPDYFMLHFNKGITLAGLERYEEALNNIQRAVQLNPKHAGSHNAMARLLHMNDKRIPALMAYGRFMVLEPQSERAKLNLNNMQTLMKGNVNRTGKKDITINIDPGSLADTTADGKPKENRFATTDLLLQFSSALDFDKKYAKETEVERFIRKFDTVCSSLKETKKDNYGFYWDYYAPYFIAMQEQKQLETFAHLVHATSGNQAVDKWLKNHPKEIDKFYDWSSRFSWNKP